MPLHYYVSLKVRVIEQAPGATALQLRLQNIFHYDTVFSAQGLWKKLPIELKFLFLGVTVKNYGLSKILSKVDPAISFALCESKTNLCNPKL